MACINLGFTSIGCSKNEKSSVSIDTQKVSKTVANSIMNSISDEKTVIVSSQNQNVSIKGSCCSPIVIDQSAQLKVINTSKMDVKMVSDIAIKFKDGMTKELDAKANEMNSLLGSQVGGQLTAAIKNSVTKISESNNFKNSIQKKISETFANQGQNINIECGEEIPTPKPPVGSGLPDTGCYISQSFLYEQLANNIMETMMSDIIKDEKVDEIISKISQKNITPQLQKIGKFERTPMSWFETNIETIGLILLVFFIPLIIKFIKVM